MNTDEKRENDRVFKILERIALQFKRSGIPSSRLDAEVLVASYINKDRSALYRGIETVLSEEEERGIMAWVTRRLQGEPVAYILGKKEFWSLEFYINRSVLVPRPETEILVESVLSRARTYRFADCRMLEIGTGSGAISVALASELQDVRIFATDISTDALAVARENARRHGVGQRVFFMGGNLFEPLRGTFDIITSNPPYISEIEFEDLSAEIRNYEPKRALVAGPEGTEFHKKLIEMGGAYLQKGGWLVIEIGYGQREPVERMLREIRKYDYIDFQADYAGIDRVASARRGGNG